MRRSIFVCLVIVAAFQSIAVAEPADNPVGPKTMSPGDILQIESLVDGTHVRRSVVEPDGNLALGARWGRVKVAGKSLLDAEAVVRDHIGAGTKDPKVQVTYLGHSVDGSPGGGQIEGGEVLAKLSQFERDIAEFKSIMRELRNLKPR